MSRRLARAEISLGDCSWLGSFWVASGLVTQVRECWGRESPWATKGSAIVFRGAVGQPNDPRRQHHQHFDVADLFMVLGKKVVQNGKTAQARDSLHLVRLRALEQPTQKVYLAFSQPDVVFNHPLAEGGLTDTPNGYIGAQ